MQRYGTGGFGEVLHRFKQQDYGQSHIYTVYKWYFWQGIHQRYGHIWRIYVTGQR